MAAVVKPSSSVVVDEDKPPKAGFFSRGSPKRKQDKTQNDSPSPSDPPAASPASAQTTTTSQDQSANGQAAVSAAASSPPSSAPDSGAHADVSSTTSPVTNGAHPEPAKPAADAAPAAPSAPDVDTSSSHSHAAVAASAPGVVPPGGAPGTGTGSVTSAHGPAPSSGDSNAHTGTSTTLPPPGDDRDTTREGDKEKDKGSLDATLTSTPNKSRAGRKRSAPSSKVATTEKPVTQASSATRSSSKTQRTRSNKPRTSLLARIVQALVPCVSPAAFPEDAMATTLDSPSSQTAPGTTTDKQAEAKSTGVKTETTQAVPESEKAAAAAATSSTVPAVADHPQNHTSGTAPAVAVSPAAPATVQTINVVDISPDKEIIVPPTPTKVVSPDAPEGVTSGGVVPPGATANEVTALRHQHHQHPHTPHESGDESDGTSFTEDEAEDEHQVEHEEDDEDRLILNGGAGIPIGPDGTPRPLLPPVLPQHAGRKCLVLDLDETLVHSSFKSIQQADYVVPVEIEYHWHNVYVIKRPGVDNFLKKMGEIYEIVVFTASLSKYADPVLDKLDIHRVVTHRLFRESCYNHRGNYVKDLSQLGRPIADTIILDNSPASYIFHPNNAVPVSSWFNDPHDTELTDLCPFLADLGTVDDVRGILDGGL